MGLLFETNFYVKFKVLRDRIIAKLIHSTFNNPDQLLRADTMIRDRYTLL